MNQRARDRLRTSWHEAGHATVALALGIPVDAASIRKGRTFTGVTLLGISADQSRDEREQRIIIVLAGDLAGQLVEYPSGYRGPSDDETVAATATEALDRQSPRVSGLLAMAETSDDVTDDWTDAWRRIGSLNGWSSNDLMLVQAHYGYLRALANSIVLLHIHAIRVLATALVERTVLDGPEIEAIVKSTRCVCHAREWIDRPKQVPVSLMSPIVDLRTVQVAAYQDPGVITLPEDPKRDNVVAARHGFNFGNRWGMVIVYEGEQFDRHHPIVRAAPDSFRPLAPEEEVR